PEQDKVLEDPVLLQSAAEPTTLIVTADEKTQHTTFQLLPPKPLRMTFDANSHTVQHEAQLFGFINEVVVGPPTVFQPLSKTFPTVWCAINSEFASARLRNLATFDSAAGSVPWDAFVETNKAR